MAARPPSTGPRHPGTLGRDPAPGLGPDGRIPEGFRVQAPAVSLPKGGGAISGIGEKVSANPVTGSARIEIPLPLTPGRGGFTPALSLSYDSGAGNGPFGLGWRLSAPSVRRKTDKGLPRYLDEQDTFILSDAEDLVPMLAENPTTGDWEPVTRTVLDGADTWTVQRFRPRVEGSFSLIERWKRDDGRVFWRTISPNNVRRVYGRSDAARVVDPDDERRVFQWLLEEEQDERGDVISWQYVAEDGAGLDFHPAESRRNATYRYVKRVSYGNTAMGENPDDGGSGSFRFHLVFDYGDHDTTDPGTTPDQTWPGRADPFSSFRSRFDLRCRRLCQRVLMFHDFAALRDDGASTSVPAVVRSVELSYDERATVTTLASAQVKGWSWRGSPSTGSGYDTETLPATTFSYTQPTIDKTLRFVDGLQELPNGLDMRSWQLVDLDGEGLAGLLTEQGGQWFYKRNEGDGAFARARSLGRRPNVRLGEAGTRLVDLDGDGNLDVVVLRPGRAGSYARTPEGGWRNFRRFSSVPNVRADDPDARFADLDGDGIAELVVTQGDFLVWYPGQGCEGYGAPVRVPMPHDPDQGPRFLFSRNGSQFYFADMSGDGLPDVVRIRNGNVSYWPNLGYGRFGARVHMKGAPRFDRPQLYDPARLRLADLDGSGPTDLLYIGAKGIKLWFNQAGNGFSEATELRHYATATRPGELQVTDLLGDGTKCLVWSAPFLRKGVRPLRYMKLMAEGKPWLLSEVDNGLGRVTRLSYTPSTAFYLADRLAGTPWATRLPFPVQCLSKLEQVDSVTGWRFVNEYAYHHGYYDGKERAFRGFGMVERWDTETVSDYDETGTGSLVASLPPVRTRTWYHTGAWRGEGTLSAAYAAEYSDADPNAVRLGEPTVPDGLSAAELRQAHRALKGRVLRQEVYAEDGSGNLDVLYTTAEQTWNVVLLQPADGDRPAAFRVDAAESISYEYDLDLSAGTPDPRVTHTLTLETDDYGVARQTATVSYPRRSATAPSGGHDAEQAARSVVVTKVEVIHQDDRVETDGIWHIGVPSRKRTWELTDTTAWTDDGAPATVAELVSAFSSATTWGFEETPTGAGPHKRLIGHEVTRYWDDGLTAALDVGELGLRALVYQRYVLAATGGLLSELYGADVGTDELSEGGYVDLDGDGSAWLPSGRLTHDATAFYVPTAHTDAFEQLKTPSKVTTLTWDADALALTGVTDAAGMTVTASIDYARMAPASVTDPNGTVSEATFDPLGRVRTTAVRNGSEGDASGAYSVEFTYDTSSLPASVHVRRLKEHGGSDWQESWVYSDGGGNVVQTKVQAAPGDAPTVSGGTVTWSHVDPRFVGTGRTVLDNKGNVVKQYEPFFSTTSDYEDEAELVEWGKAAVYAYDPIGRNTSVTLSDGSERTWSTTPWKVEAADEEDNLSGGDHEGTPTVTWLDALGRVYKQVVTPDGSSEYETRLELDVQGNVLTVTDPRGNDIQVQRFDLLGRACFTGAADEGYDGSSGDGETTVFFAADGQPIRTWRSGGLTVRRTFDALRRPVGVFADEGSGEKLVELRFYGDVLTDATGFSQGRVVRVYDTAGEQRFAYDFRGRVTSQSRTVIEDITAEADWSGLAGKTSLSDIDAWLASSGGLDGEAFSVTTDYDALDRVTQQTAPDSSKTVPTYDAGGRLTTVEVFVRGAASSTSFVTEILYNARGQRESITYGNNTASTYTYDADRFWLTRLLTERSAASAHGAATLQDLGYTRDRVGNITTITDAAQETVFFSNAQVSPTRRFGYDSLYRLVWATGREKVSQTQSTAWYADYAGAMGAIPDPGNPALRAYTQSYTYDAAGNITEMKHQQGSGGTVLWRRGYAYEAGNNQLLSTSLPGDDPDDPATHSDTYTYTARGAMASLPHLGALTRDFRDQLRKVELDTAGNVAWYSYDADGQRVRKVVDKGSVVEERIYVGGYEVWRKKNGSGVVQEERQTLHVMDDARRIAMVETLTVTGGSTVSSPTPRFRYQLDDHLGTALLEVDDDGGVISYEEYHPYGTTAWWAEASAIQVSRKRYRYTGKEKDEETGLYYHGHRYYMPWLGRWERADPAGLKDGPNRYRYARNNPITFSDPTGRFPSPSRFLKNELIYVETVTDKAGALLDTAATAMAHPIDTLGAVATEMEKKGAIGIARDMAETTGTAIVSAMGGSAWEAFHLATADSDAEAKQRAENLVELQGAQIEVGLSLLGGSATTRVLAPLTKPVPALAYAGGGVEATVVALPESVAVAGGGAAGGTIMAMASGSDESGKAPIDETAAPAEGASKTSTKVADPGTIRFTQDSMKRTFGDGRTVQDLIEDLKTGAVTADDVPPIRIFEQDGKVFSLDNRRLKAFQEAGVPIRTVQASAEEIANEAWKMTTRTDGLSIRVRGGGL